jgi:hypothetical protein
MHEEGGGSEGRLWVQAAAEERESRVYTKQVWSEKLHKLAVAQLFVITSMHRRLHMPKHTVRRGSLLTRFKLHVLRAPLPCRCMLQAVPVSHVGQGGRPATA